MIILTIYYQLLKKIKVSEKTLLIKQNISMVLILNQSGKKIKTKKISHTTLIIQ
jgi:hypothetical protein